MHKQGVVGALNWHSFITALETNTLQRTSETDGPEPEFLSQSSKQRVLASYFHLNLASQLSLVNKFLKFNASLSTLSVSSTLYFSVLTDKIICYKITWQKTKTKPKRPALSDFNFSTQHAKGCMHHHFM